MPDGRFAPSPTGTLHLGNLRTALLAWLFARSADARFLVRMEDLDTGRVRERFYDEQLHDLAALGLDWDGPVVRQSERLALYADAIEALRADGLVYECWCTRAEIRDAARRARRVRAPARVARARRRGGGGVRGRGSRRGPRGRRRLRRAPQRRR